MSLAPFPPRTLCNVIVWSVARRGMGRLGIWDNQEAGIEVQKELERDEEVRHESEQEPKVLVLSLRLMSGLSNVSLAHSTPVRLLFYPLSSLAILRIKLQLTQRWKFRTRASERLTTNQRCAR